ncbi:hypothetical protein ACS0TY_013724 [Phlomoides rotata]
MTLEDFFTLTEMNNGLTAPSRVRELMAVMEKERDCIVKNAADSTRQWSAVARAIAATENNDCLDLFLHLDGLHFISKWLKDAQKFGDDKVDSFVEELITHLLQAVEKLDLDYEKLVASEIWTTVQNLFLHNSSKVQEKARAMFESWKSKTDSNPSILDVDKSGAVTVDEAGKSADTDRGIRHSETSPCNGSVSRETSVNTKDHVFTKDDPVLSTTSDAIHPDQVESGNNLDKIGDERSLFHVGSPSVLKPTMEPPPCLSVGTTSESRIPAVPRQDTLEESSKYSTQSLKSESLSGKLGVLEETKMSKGRSTNSSSDDFEEMKAVTELSSQRNSTAGDKSSCDEVLSCIDSRTTDSGGKGVKDEVCGSNQYRNSREFIAKERGDFSHYMLPRSSSNEKSWGHKDLRASPSGIEDEGKTNAFNLHGSDRANNYTFHKKLMDSGPDRAGSKKSDVEIDYGLVDPLEVARQVAMEVEREYVDYREPSCSSSEKLPESNTRPPNSSDSVSQSRSGGGSPMKVGNEPNSPEESSPTQEASATSSEDLDAEQADATQDMATSQVTEVAQEAADEEKGLCNLDLNQEVTLEDSDRPRNQFSAPVSIVSASRAAAVPAQPSAPLQFEGNLGWKGSAVTSAFRPAGGSSSSSKQRQGFLDFDLNVAENIDPKTGESSAETSSRKSEHLALDLNHTSDDSGSTLDWRIGQFLPQHHNHPLLSSKQPIRNIDLNDQPSYHNDSSANTYLSPVSRNFNVSRGANSDETVISIMGTRVEVNRKDFISQTPPLPNGRTPELAFDVNLRGAGNFLGIGSALPYTHSSMYGYNNIAPGPSMPFSSIYGSGGPIPYMVDSRGQHVIPQIVGSAPAAFSQPPFVLNMNSSTPSNGAGPSRSSFDLNSGMLMESGSKDPSGFGLFLNSAQVRSVDEQLRPHPQPILTSVIGGKRKEPENGWENYPFKHYTPPWKQI